MQGRIYKSTGSWYSVCDDNNHFWNARIKGKLKIDEEISSTNPIAVGDIVLFEIEDEDKNTAIISNVIPRNNYIVRVSPHNKSQKHIIASNIDMALIVASIANPRTSTGFIDRFLLTAEAYHIPAIIVINKIDLLKKKNAEILDVWLDIYKKAGYEVYPVIATQKDTLIELSERMQNKTTLLFGHSGVGKSTLLNAFLPGSTIRTQEVSGWSGKGQHTTTFAEMYQLPTGGNIIDTPGVKEFGIIDMKKEELSHYFPEMRKMLNNCKYNNCLHINEPDCAIKTAANNNIISMERYINYALILDSLEKKWE